jgi:hypothetical protein
MDFADWIVAGLDQLRTGQLPGGQGLYQSVSTGLGGHPELDAFMTTGDPAARARLVQLIAQTTAANPGFEQRLRATAAAAQGDGGPVETPFLKSSNGIVALVAAAVLVVGGGVGLAIGLSAGGSDSGGTGRTGGTAGVLGADSGGGKGAGGGLVSVMKGTWTCTGVGGGGTVTIGEGTWTTGGDSGTWTLNGSKATLTSKTNPGDDIDATGVPSAPGAFDITAAGPSDGSSATPPAHLTGTVSAHQLKVTLAVPGSDMNPSITCTK